MKNSSFSCIHFFFGFIFILIFQFTALQMANAQISITKSTVESVFQGGYEVNSSVSEDSEAIKSLYDRSGADQVWDFTTLSYDENFTSSGTLDISTSLEEAPLNDDSHFEQATHVMTAEFITDTLSFDLYSYHIFNDDELILLGSVMVEEGETDPDFVNYNRPGDIEYQFPATFEDSWNFEYEDEITFGSSSQISDISVNIEIEGWGKVITEDGESDVLRIRRTETTEMEGFEFDSFEILFVEENGIEIASITGESELFGDGVDEGTLGASVSSVTVGTPTSQEQISELPKRMQLKQNYPNPFNPNTQITYNLPEPSDVSLTVYSVTGEQVATLVDQPQSAGTHTVPFDASGLASGTYIYRLTANNQVLTRKMTLIK
ncbi:MAG: T9SS type A sorting domain-containing protein [Bacteroidota bacterium]